LTHIQFISLSGHSTFSSGSMVTDHQSPDLCPKPSFFHNLTTGYHCHWHSFYSKNDR